MSERIISQAEEMDADDVDPQQLERALRFIRRINAGLGYNRAVVKEVAALAGERRKISLLDVACGSGDLLESTAQWAEQNGIELTAVGVDRHAYTCQVAQRHGNNVVRGDALRLPCPDRSFDIVTCNLFLHHLPNNAVIGQVLAELSRVSRLGFVAADLLRNRRATMWIRLFTLTADPLTRHDAVLSVRQAFTWRQAETVAALPTSKPMELRRCFGHRFLLVGRSNH